MIKDKIVFNIKMKEKSNQIKSNHENIKNKYY